MTTGTEPVTGGCQCGRIRYEIAGGAEPVSICHCRMCQRASGNLFLAIVPVPHESFRWLNGAPETYASSTIANRDFCASCGTPLSFRFVEGDFICLGVGTLDDPEWTPRPGRHVGAESRVSWFHEMMAWPVRTSDENESITPERRARFVSHQGDPDG